MDTNNIPYNPQPQYPQQPPMPGMMPPMPPRGQWQQRAMNAIGRVRNVSFPKWLTQYGVVVYILALAVVSVMYSSNSLPWYYMLSGVVSVMAFFLYGSTVVGQTSIIKMRREKSFEKRIFTIAFVPRIIWMVLIYTIFMQYYGNAFGFDNGDATFYDELGQDFSKALRESNFFSTWRAINTKTDVSDMGYGAYVGLIYWVTGNSIIAVRLLKCLWSSITVLLVYRIAKRNFEEQTARIAAIFCALWPNFWYYCGVHLKETEMVFLSVLFVEQADQMIRSRQFTMWKVVPVLLIGAMQFGFRTPLAVVEFLALLFTIVMSSERVVSWGKRIIVGGLAVLLVGLTMGNRIQEESRSLFEQAKSNQQQQNMEWRSTRKHGNSFAKYAGASVFAPMIFTIPFPSMVQIEGLSEMPMLLNGGNFGKNIISFFVLVALVTLLMTGKWRDHMLPLAFMLGYVLVLTMSSFAQSERFHQPAMPFEFMFAAYGISIALTKPKYKRWFTYWCGLMFVACIAWNWFKMAGRGLS